MTSAPGSRWMRRDTPNWLAPGQLPTASCGFGPVAGPCGWPKNSQETTANPRRARPGRCRHRRASERRSVPDRRRAPAGRDRSGASRLVGDTVEHGNLIRTTSLEDARRAVLTVTTAGQELLTSSRAWQEEVHGQLTAEWATDDAAMFASQLPPNT